MVSAGAKVAVINDVPVPTTVARLPTSEITELFADAKVHEPGVLLVAGSAKEKTLSP